MRVERWRLKEIPAEMDLLFAAPDLREDWALGSATTNSRRLNSWAPASTLDGSSSNDVTVTTASLSLSVSLSSAMIFHFWLFSFLFSSTSSPIRVLNYLVFFVFFLFLWFGLICCWIILVILLEMTELLFCCCYLDWFGLICCWYYFWLFSFGLICCWDYFGLNFCWRGQKLYFSGPIEFIYMLLLLLFLGL